MAEGNQDHAMLSDPAAAMRETCAKLVEGYRQNGPSNWRRMVEQIRDLPLPTPQPRLLADQLTWQSMESAPRDGRGFLAFGIHADPVARGAERGVKPGDYWWAILLFDVWRVQKQFVFAKDGTLPWSAPIAWAELQAPTIIIGELAAMPAKAGVPA